MKTIVVEKCDLCPHRYAETGEYPSDRCCLSGRHLDQDTTPCGNRPIPIPDHCPLRKSAHTTKPVRTRLPDMEEPDDAD